MSERLRIVFMGTPDFAVATLKALVEHHYKVVGVITAPDKPAGRGQKLQESAVKHYAQSKNLPILQPTNLKDVHFVEALQALDANLQVVVAFRMLPEVVWKMPKYGTFNLHASLLPDYRGAAPIHWALINGETKTGVTTFFIDEKIDTGAIIMKDEIAIAPDETVGSLHDKLMVLGSELVLKTVRLIETGKVSTTLQPPIGDLKMAPKLNKDNCKIDWNQPLDAIYNKIRGLNPFPTAWCYLSNGSEELTVKLFSVAKEVGQHVYNPGQILVTKTGLKVATKDGYVIIHELQLPGKRKMDIKSLLNGFQFQKGSTMF